MGSFSRGLRNGEINRVKEGMGRDPQSLQEISVTNSRRFPGSSTPLYSDAGSPTCATNNLLHIWCLFAPRPPRGLCGRRDA
eukprot:scaffold116751_cov35-Tisochrysis_lutea.AAC.1